jgi:hypothetical protein
LLTTHVRISTQNYLEAYEKTSIRASIKGRLLVVGKMFSKLKLFWSITFTYHRALWNQERDQSRGHSESCSHSCP